MHYLKKKQRAFLCDCNTILTDLPQQNPKDICITLPDIPLSIILSFI